MVAVRALEPPDRTALEISVFGLGYVGSVCAACFAHLGHDVIGVDTDDRKVARVSAGESPVLEPDLSALLESAVRGGRLRATSSAAEAVAGSRLSLICVGTPGAAGGRPDLTAVRRVTDEIGLALRTRRTPHTVVLRSTVLPGTTERVLAPALQQAAGGALGPALRVAYNPEFLREGSAVDDFLRPSRTVAGADGPDAADDLAELYAPLTAPFVRTSIRVAEMVKYADNSFHAVKVAFANEIGALCRAAGVESSDVMDVFLSDYRLNIAPTYLRPGFAFGGSCLPKDVRALVALARDSELELHLLPSLLASNEAVIARALDEILRLARDRIGIIGLSFKPGTDDLRGSPMVELVERLIGKGFKLAIHDRHVQLARLTGTNKAFLEQHLPHVERLFHEDLAAVVAESEVLVIGSRDEAYRDIAGQLTERQVIVDVARLFDRPPATRADYRALV
jgi:GDP-mannose 6-dehydrogenase